MNDEPCLLYSEIDGDGNELRKVDEYADGRRELADATTSMGTTMLSEAPMPPLQEINADPEFDGDVISAAEFEQVWSEALRTAKGS